MIDHKKIDAVTDILAEIFEATQNNLTNTVALGLVNERPITSIHNELKKTAKQSLDFTSNILGSTGSMLGISTDELDKLNRHNMSSVVRQYQLKDSASLRKDLYKATMEGIDKQPKVRTKGGQRWGYKEYMEMKVRTTIAREAGDMQLEFGGEAGVVFYLCNTFQDSADDHADFQGKYYYDDRFREFGYSEAELDDIVGHIKKNKLLPMQYVRENKPYLGTRPNCRHTFTPVSIDQVLKVKPEKLSKDLGITTGTYRDENYKATQALRVAERSIRNYKHKANLTRRLGARATDPADKVKFMEQAAHNERYLKAWRNRRGKLVKNNAHLDVDYRRETRKKILQDIGVKYNIEGYTGAELDVPLDFGVFDNSIPEEVLDEAVNRSIVEVINEGYMNKSISKTAIQERDLDDFAYTSAAVLVNNEKLQKKWQPALISMINDFPELDVLEHYDIRQNKRTRAWGTAKRGVNAKFRGGFAKVKWHFGLEFSNPLLKDYDYVVEHQKDAYKDNTFSSGKVERTLVHELAHVLDGALSRKKIGITDKRFLELKSISDGKSIPRDKFLTYYDDLKVVGNLEFSSDFFDEFIKSEYIQKEKPRGVQQTMNVIHDKIGWYSSTSKAEFFAESFTKWYLSDTPDGEFEKTFGDLFYKMRGELK